jgi:hypothetical protein
MADREVLRSGSVGPYRWKVDPMDHRSFLITRPGTSFATRLIYSTPQGVMRWLQTDWMREKEAAAALRSDDPLALCRLGWHSLGETFVDRGPFFHWMGSGRIGERLNFWVGPEPFRWCSTRVAGLGPQAVPWLCSVCNEVVPDATP